MKAQLTISVNAGKWLISEAILRLPEIKKAFWEGKIILKGGTTVSCIAEKLLGTKLKISGRITARGTVTSFETCDSPHSVLIEKGKWKNIDDCFYEEVMKLGPKDMIIVGANVIDMEGNAAMMAASPGGGNPGQAFTALATEGATIIIAAGLEKLIPGKVSDIIKKTGRRSCDFSMGAAVGLMPIYGQIITELEALKILGNVEATIIGRGGINGGEGSTTVLIEGSEESLKKVIKEVLSANSMPISGHKKSLHECAPGSPGCEYHLSCFHAKKSNIVL